MPKLSLAERRGACRYPIDGMAVCVRVKGRLNRVRGWAVDFNRHGLTLLVNDPIPKDKKIYLGIELGNVRLEDVVGVIHSCLPQPVEAGMPQQFRCGVQFRTRSQGQFDCDEVEQALYAIERRTKLD